MKVDRNALTSGILVVLATVAAGGLFFANFLIWLLGLTTILDDAKNASKGIVASLQFLAAIPSWVLGGIAVLLVIHLIQNTYRALAVLNSAKLMFSIVDENRKEIREFYQSFSQQIGTVDLQLANFAEKWDFYLLGTSLQPLTNLPSKVESITERLDALDRQIAELREMNFNNAGKG